MKGLQSIIIVESSTDRSDRSMSLANKLLLSILFFFRLLILPYILPSLFSIVVKNLDTSYQPTDPINIHLHACYFCSQVRFSKQVSISESLTFSRWQSDLIEFQQMRKSLVLYALLGWKDLLRILTLVTGHRSQRVQRLEIAGNDSTLHYGYLLFQVLYLVLALDQFVAGCHIFAHSLLLFLLSLSKLLLVVALHLLQQGNLSQDDFVVLRSAILYLILRVCDIGLFFIAARLIHGFIASLDTFYGPMSQLLKLSGSDPALKQLVFQFFDSLILFLHIDCPNSLFLLQKFYLFLVKFGLLRQFLQINLNLILLAIVGQLLQNFLRKFLLLYKLLFELFSHGSLLFDDQLNLRTFLGHGAFVFISALELADFVLVHFDLFVRVCEFFVQYFKTLLPLEDAFSLLWTILLVLRVEFLLDSTLDLQKFSLQFGVLQLKGLNKLVLWV